MMPLTFAPIGTPAVIRKIIGKDDVRQHLAELGFVAGQEVTVVSSLNGNLIINVKGSRIALDETMARRVMLQGRPNILSGLAPPVRQSQWNIGGILR